MGPVSTAWNTKSRCQYKDTAGQSQPSGYVCVCVSCNSAVVCPFYVSQKQPAPKPVPACIHTHTHKKEHSPRLS